jgi:hypothetical protein
MNSPGSFFHYEPLFTSSFRKNLIIHEAEMFSKDLMLPPIFNLSKLFLTSTGITDRPAQLVNVER